MPFGAVVALAGGEPLLAVVIKAAGFAADNEDNLAVGGMAVEAYGTADVEPSAHNLVGSVVEGSEHRVALSALELRVGDFCYFVEVYYHCLCVDW